MENNIFIFTEDNITLNFEKFHICTWEFMNNSGLIEFGGELKELDDIKTSQVNLKIYIPWLTKKEKIKDLYKNLKESENSRFIFNDSVLNTISLDGGKNRNGVIQEFQRRKPLCIIPIYKLLVEDKNIVSLELDLKPLSDMNNSMKPNVYFRFLIEVSNELISIRKNGISKSTVIYDFKVNERRNLPVNLSINNFCKIDSCFNFIILPNSFEISFYDSNSIKNVRTLEFDSFKKYLNDDRVKKNELVVVFNKKNNEESYSFFSIFTKERIGTGQFALAIFVNLICGILLFLPNYKFNKEENLSIIDYLKTLPIELYISIIIGFTIVIYFIWPKIKSIFKLNN